MPAMKARTISPAAGSSAAPFRLTQVAGPPDAAGAADPTSARCLIPNAPLASIPFT